jgi:hypothetical protein
MKNPSLDSLIFFTDSNPNAFGLISVDSSQIKSDTIPLKQAETLIPTGFIGKDLPKTPSGETWVSVLFLALFLFFAYVVSRGRKMIEQTIKDFFYFKERASIFSDSTVTELRHRIYLICISVISIAFFSYHLLYDLNTSDFSMVKMGVLIGVIAGFLLIKYLFFQFIGSVFFTKAITLVWIRSYFTLFFATGLGLFFISILLVYSAFSASKVIVWIGLGWIFVITILLVYKLVQIFLNRFYSIFYLMLYLCTLEIIPILVLGKVLLKV